MMVSMNDMSHFPKLQPEMRCVEFFISFHFVTRKGARIECLDFVKHRPVRSTKPGSCSSKLVALYYN